MERSDTEKGVGNASIGYVLNGWRRCCARAKRIISCVCVRVFGPVKISNNICPFIDTDSVI